MAFTVLSHAGRQQLPPLPLPRLSDGRSHACDGCLLLACFPAEGSHFMPPALLESQLSTLEALPTQMLATFSNEEVRAVPPSISWQAPLGSGMERNHSVCSLCRLRRCLLCAQGQPFPSPEDIVRRLMQQASTAGM